MILSRYLHIFFIMSILSFIVCLETFILQGHSEFRSYAFGATSATNPSKSAGTSFNAEGTINTILSSPVKYNNTNTVNDINTNLSSNYLLGGKWRIDIQNDNVTYFKTNFTMINTDGNDIHFHTIVYKPVANEPMDSGTQNRLGFVFKIKNNNTLGFDCKVDILTNGVLEWEDVPIAVSLINEKVILMDINDQKTGGHFLNKPIYGLINSVDMIQQ
jgi:hypothetical protein